MRLRRDNIVTALALVVIAVAIPFAVKDTLESGRRRLRFILQPLFAILLGVRGGLAEARAGNPPFLSGLLFDAADRGALRRSGLAAITTLLAMGIILDIVFQLVLYHEGHPGAALAVGPILIALPYAWSRGVTKRLAR